MSDNKKAAEGGKQDNKKDQKKDNKKQSVKKTDGDAKAGAKAAGGKNNKAPAKDAKAPAPAKAETEKVTTKQSHAKAAAAPAPATAAPAAAHTSVAHQDTRQGATHATPAAAHATHATHATHAAPISAEQKALEQKAPFLKKIVKAKGEKATELELSVARAMFELEHAAKDQAVDLSDLYITAAKEVDVAGKKAVVIFVPYKQHGKFKKVQGRLVRELEKKLAKLVCIVAQRTILSKNYTRSKGGQLRPRSRTLTAVHNAILDDLVYPTLIVGKRLRVKLDGSRLIKIFLDPKDVKEVDYKLKTFQSVYKKLTNKTVEFSFPAADE